MTFKKSNYSDIYEILLKILKIFKYMEFEMKETFKMTKKSFVLDKNYLLINKQL